MPTTIHVHPPKLHRGRVSARYAVRRSPSTPWLKIVIATVIVVAILMTIALSI